MQGAVAACAAAFAIVLLAELGDKSQLLLVARAAQAPARRVAAEAVAAFAVLTALAVTAGAAALRLVPAWALALAAALLFVAFGLLAVRQARAGPAPAPSPAAGTWLAGHPEGRRGGTFALVLVSEMGDKTQLATAALAAATGHPLAVCVGAFLALAASAVLAVAAGRWLANRLDARRRAWLAAALFLGLGVATLAWLAADVA